MTLLRYIKRRSYYFMSSMQNDPVVSKASELLRLGLMPSLEEVRAGKVRNVLYLFLFCYLTFLPGLVVRGYKHNEGAQVCRLVGIFRETNGVNSMSDYIMTL